MTPQRFQQVRKLFEAALERETSERAAFVANACQNDQELHTEVVRLLEAHEATVTLRRPASSPAPAPPVPGSREGQRVGDYEILRPLGRGGMGSVYLARRADDAFHKHVAIKILRADVASPDVLPRFRQEREILAALDHPNIARLLDAGDTVDGLPYFVMEYVEGRSISQYADGQQLPTRERIELFRQVCDAVEYAHQRKIVHRDLKPSNVLVTVEGQVKLLDFGIARLLEQDAGTPGLTLGGMWMMTSEYASPEQVRGEVAGRESDVYSLGVILFELLTGHRPYHLRNRIFHEIVRVVCEEPPTRPSLVIAQPVETTAADGRPATLPPETAGRLRQTSLGELKRQLAGDLDNILLKALDKEASRRYASSREFSGDLVRHLDGASVSAKGASPLYLAGKFARRYRWWIAVALALSVGISTGAVRINPLVALEVAPVLLAVALGYYLTRTELGKAMADRRAFPHFVFMAIALTTTWVFVKFAPNPKVLLRIATAVLVVGFSGQLVRWVLGRQWAGLLLLEANRPITRAWKVRRTTMVFSALGYLLVSILKKWSSGELPIDDLSYAAFWALFAVHRNKTWGKVEVRSRGIFAEGGFWPWSTVKSYAWEPTEGSTAVLKIRRRARPDWWPGGVAIPVAKKDQMAAILARQLGEWPAGTLHAAAGGDELTLVPSPASSFMQVWGWIIMLSILAVLMWLYMVYLPAGSREAPAVRSPAWRPVGPDDSSTRAANDAVVRFHDAFSNAQYLDACVVAQPGALRRITRLPCPEFLEWVHDQLGAVVSAKRVSSGQFDKRIRMEFVTHHARGESREVFEWLASGGQIKLTSYYIDFQPTGGVKR